MSEIRIICGGLTAGGGCPILATATGDFNGELG